MRRDHRAPWELQKCILQRPECFDIQIIRRLVEQQEVAAHFQREREVQSVALATGEHLGGLLLVGPFEAECRDIRPGRQLDVAHLDPVQAIADDFPHILGRIEAGP